jgi:hypothetical protein
MLRAHCILLLSKLMMMMMSKVYCWSRCLQRVLNARFTETKIKNVLHRHNHACSMHSKLSSTAHSENSRKKSAVQNRMVVIVHQLPKLSYLTHGREALP